MRAVGAAFVGAGAVRSAFSDRSGHTDMRDSRASLCAVVGGLWCRCCGSALVRVQAKAELAGSSTERRKTRLPIPLVHGHMSASDVCELLLGASALYSVAWR